MIHTTKPAMPHHLAKLKKGYVYLGEVGTFIVPEKWKGVRCLSLDHQEPYYASLIESLDEDNWSYDQGWDEIEYVAGSHRATKIGSTLHRLQPWYKDKDTAKKRAFIKNMKVCYREMFGEELTI